MKTTKKNNKSEQDIEKSLSAIYRDESGKMPDLTTFEPVTSRWWLYAVGAFAAFVVVLVAAAWAGFTFFKPFRGFSGQGLVIQIEGPERVSLGQETSYFINYQNGTSDPLAAAEIRVSFPTDFVVVGVEPRPTGKDLTWRIGSIPRDGRGTFKIRGTFTGALGTVTAVQVVGTYRPASFNSDFETLATKVLNYEDSVLRGTVIAPVKALPGDQIVLGYVIENTGPETLEKLEARLTLPEGFQREATSSHDALDGRVVRIPIGNLSAGASTTVSVRGSFASGVSGEARVIAETGRTSSEGTFLASQRTETSFTVLAGDLALKLVVNGSDTDATLLYGSALRMTLHYENTATENLKDVKLRLRIENATTTGKTPPPLVDWASYDDTASGTRKGDTVTWTKTQVPAFARLPTNEEGSIEVSMDALQAAKGGSDLAFRIILEAEVGAVGATKVTRVVKAAPITLRYLTDADIVSEARYYSEEGAPIGSGPLPPMVGQPTTYRVHWQIAKRFHELKNLKITATLPKIASWPNKTIVDAGAISYDDKTRTVTWNLNRLPADVKETTIEFDVTITPGEADANRFAQLLGETRFDATDANLNQPVFRTQPSLTTDLENDEGAKSKGVVRKP